MPRNRQQIPRAERESAVLAAAVPLFAANGYRGTSVAAVARAAGLATAAAVHWYYPTKDDLFAAVVASIFDAARNQVESDPAIGGDPYGELVGLLAQVQSYRSLHREAYERMDESAAVRSAYERIQAWLDKRLFATIEGRAPRGVDLDSIADAVHVLFEGFLVSSRKADRPAEELIGMVVDALVAVASTRSA